MHDPANHNKRKEPRLMLIAGTLFCWFASAFFLICAQTSLAEETALLPIVSISDKAIESRLNKILSHIDGFKNVHIEVTDGVVRLTGKTERQETADQVGQMVSRFEGVIYVNNQIQVESDVETRVTPAIERVRQYVSIIMEKLPVIIIAILVIFAFWIFSRLATRWNYPYEQLGINRLLKHTIRQLLRKIILLLGILLALDILDWTAAVSAMLGTAGVIGLAIGFAFKDIVENYLAGLLLSFRRPFGLNDLVKIESHEGRVLRMTSSELVLMTLDGNHVRIPNASVFKSFICNYSINPLRRFDFVVGVGVSENLLNVQMIGCDTLKRMDGVLNDPEPFMLTEDLGDFNVIVRFYGWVDQRVADFGKVRSKAIRGLKQVFDDAGIDMPEPIQTVRLERVLDSAVAESSSKAIRNPVKQADDLSKATDISPDDQLDDQIKEDLLKSDEANLLVNNTPG